MSNNARAPRLAVAFTALAIAALRPSEARAFDPYLVVPEPSVAEATPAYRYANMTNDEAYAELDKRSILYSKVDAKDAPGVKAPIRITGRLHGVYVHSSLPPEKRVTSPFEICDARLALSIDDFAAVLEKHDIDEIIHFTMYRPFAGALPGHGPRDTAPMVAVKHDVATRSRAHSVAKAPAKSIDAKAATQTKHEAPPLTPKQKTDDEAPKPVTIVTKPAIVRAKATKKGIVTKPSTRAHRDPKPVIVTSATNAATPGSRHPAGLAIDVGLLHKKDGRWISVARSFHGKIGEKTCGEGARVPDDADARELRSLVCEPEALKLFTYVLTPNYNAAHVDHFHMEVKPAMKWFLYH